MGRTIQISAFGLILFASLQGSPEALAARCQHNSDHFSCVEYVRNYDGDSITFDIPDVHPLLGSEIMIRINGIDSPEMVTDDDCEKEMAHKAQEEVQKLMERARRVDLENPKRDKYFRVVADVYADGKSIAEHMLRKRLAVEYDGGTKHSVDWCRR